MTLRANQATTLTVTLDSGGVPLSIPPSAMVSAQLLAVDAVTQLSPGVSVSPTAIGANFAVGALVIFFSANDTAALVPPGCVLKVTVAVGADSRDWTFEQPVASAVTERSALFVRSLVLAQFRSDRLVTVQRYLSPTLSDDALWEKIVAAESDAQHRLRTLFQPTRIFAGDPTDPEIQALAGAPYLVEPAYDHSPDAWSGDAWGFLATRQSPVISIDSMALAYPPPSQTVFTVPLAWIRVDRKYGHIQLVPTGFQGTAPLAMVPLQALGTGRTVPQTVVLRYTAGLQNAAGDYPELLDLVQRMAVHRMLLDAMPAASGSISADGLSQSISPPDLDKHGEAIDKALGALRDRIHGIRLAVV